MFYYVKLSIAFLLSICLYGCGNTKKQDEKPNVIIIMTDDQGYGDLGVTGNPHVKTPVIDQFAKKSVQFNNFYVSPVCSPTRSSLMTGRYSLRTGVRDTYNGGAIMATEEETIAEVLKKAGYQTGIFGKWHLGDNYPSRPKDQGFDESLIHLAGGMGQVGDITTFFKGSRSYFNPILWKNGNKKHYKGYCSDIFADNAIKFIEKNKKNRFFCYLSFNAPHTPLQVPKKYYQMYKNVDPSKGFANEDGKLDRMTEQDKESAKRVYAMISNIDENIGKLFKKLEKLKLVENTIVIFMTDNGPQQIRYNAAMRGTKSSVFRGGVRVPFYLRYPKKFKENKTIFNTVAHIDVLPTIAEICGVEMPKDRVIDGRSFVSLIKGDKKKQKDFQNRNLFFYWTRRYPQPYQNIAIQQGDYKLVGKNSFDAPIEKFYLFNISMDPGEKKNIVLEKKLLANNMKKNLDKIYKNLIQSKNLINKPFIHIGTKHQNPTFLTRNDADGAEGIWEQQEIYGKWRVRFEEGKYNVKFSFISAVDEGIIKIEAGRTIYKKQNNEKKVKSVEIKNVYFPKGNTEFIPSYYTKGKNILPLYIKITKKN